MQAVEGSSARRPGCRASKRRLRGYVPMGLEIADDLDGDVDALTSAVGTGAALMGADDGLRQIKDAMTLPAIICR